MKTRQQAALGASTLKLPLAYSSHRQIVDAEGNRAIEVFSGGPGTEAADQLQDLVVVACNAHAALISALKEATDALAGGLWDYGPGQDERAKCDEVLVRCRAALAAAGAA